MFCAEDGSCCPTNSETAMASRKVVHIIGTGTIGEPLIGLFSDRKDLLGFDEVTFHKRTPLLTDRSKVVNLIKRGARLACDDSARRGLRDIGIEPAYEHHEALRQATVVIDCTPSDVGLQNKKEIYEKYAHSTLGFIAQGSEFGFGKPFVHDISNGTSFVPSPQVNRHKDERFGTHHARDAWHLFHELGYDLNLFSSALKVNSQYMHAIHFNIRLRKPTTVEAILDKLKSDARRALTYKQSANSVFSFGRDYGHYGRILNQGVLVVPTLTVHKGTEVVGFCFTPQDGNALISSVAAACWMVYPESYEQKLNCLKDSIFDEV